MARLLLLICLICVVVALASNAVSAMVRAAQDSKALAQELSAPHRGMVMERISYTALILLMLGVTSGLLGGL
ncbi:MAG: hypothetical protein Q4P24_09190 [Rhodobacterales bacterium]|nr:hypothetical protein [Rhodobacterales bacterium]